MKRVLQHGTSGLLAFLLSLTGVAAQGEALGRIGGMLTSIFNLIDITRAWGSDTPDVAYAKMLLFFLLFAVIFAVLSRLNMGRRIAGTVAGIISFISVIAIPTQVVRSIIVNYAVVAAVLLWVLPIAAVIYIDQKLIQSKERWAYLAKAGLMLLIFILLGQFGAALDEIPNAPNLLLDWTYVVMLLAFVVMIAYLFMSLKGHERSAGDLLGNILPGGGETFKKKLGEEEKLERYARDLSHFLEKIQRSESETFDEMSATEEKVTALLDQMRELREMEQSLSRQSDELYEQAQRGELTQEDQQRYRRVSKQHNDIRNRFANAIQRLEELIKTYRRHLESLAEEEGSEREATERHDKATRTTIKKLREEIERLEKEKDTIQDEKARKEIEDRIKALKRQLLKERQILRILDDLEDIEKNTVKVTEDAEELTRREHTLLQKILQKLNASQTVKSASERSRVQGEINKMWKEFTQEDETLISYQKELDKFHDQREKLREALQRRDRRALKRTAKEIKELE